MLCGLLPVYTALWCEQCDLLAVMWQAIWTGSYLEQGLMCAGPFPATFPEVMSDVPLAATVMTLLFSLWEKGNTKKGLSLQGWVVYLQVEDLTFSFSFFSDCQEDAGPLGTGPLDTSNIKEHLNLCLLELDSVPTLLTLLLGEERTVCPRWMSPHSSHSPALQSNGCSDGSRETKKRSGQKKPSMLWLRNSKRRREPWRSWNGLSAAPGSPVTVWQSLVHWMDGCRCPTGKACHMLFIAGCGAGLTCSPTMNWRRWSAASTPLAPSKRMCASTPTTTNGLTAQVRNMVSIYSVVTKV